MNYYSVPKNHLHTLNAYNSHVNNDEILYISVIVVECSNDNAHCLVLVHFARWQ